jgi:hypothetical protein
VTEESTTPDPEADTRWVLALYGATMLSVQMLEFAVAWVYLLANFEPAKSAKPVRRQVVEAFDRSWSAFQEGTGRMKLNDAKRGIKDQLAPDLYGELDRFLAGPRAQLVHRFLVERLKAPDATTLRASASPLALIRFRPGTVLELLQASMIAERLSRRLLARAEELRSAIPDAPDMPPEFREFVETLARMAMLKEFPDPLEPPGTSN